MSMTPTSSSPTPSTSAEPRDLREASREQVEAFVAHLADWAEKSRNAPLPAQQLSRQQGRGRELFDQFPISYYWSTYQSEWATDVVFRDAAVLKRLYPILMQHGITTFSSPDVMRFLGHNIPAHGQVHGNFAGEVRSDLQEREEGIRIKHKVNGKPRTRFPFQIVGCSRRSASSSSRWSASTLASAAK